MTLSGARHTRPWTPPRARRPGSRRGGAVLALSLLLILTQATSATPCAAAGKADSGRSLKQAGEAMKRLGKRVGEAGKEAGEEIADASKKVWYKGRQVSARLLKRTQSATRDWWGKVIDSKDRTIEDLREENARLKRELRGKKP